jgi:hypothetical protein
MAKPEQSAEEIFEAALDLPPGQRSEYLAQAFRQSPELRDTVVRLFSDYQRLGDFLDDPAFVPGPDSTLTGNIDPVTHVLKAGHKLGRYVIVEPLGASPIRKYSLRLVNSVIEHSTTPIWSSASPRS